MVLRRPARRADAAEISAAETGSARTVAPEWKRASGHSWGLQQNQGPGPHPALQCQSRWVRGPDAATSASVGLRELAVILGNARDCHPFTPTRSFLGTQLFDKGCSSCLLPPRGEQGVPAPESSAV